MLKYFSLSLAEVYKVLKTKDEGLKDHEAQLRLGIHGANELPEKKGTPLYIKFLEQFKDFLIILLLGAAGVSFLFGEIIDALAIVIIVVINALIGFIQEYKAEEALSALKKNEQTTAKVYRNGALKVVEAKYLVPGDVVLLEAGDQIPADCRILKAFSLKVNESMLTGESLPVTKEEGVVKVDAVLSEQTNFLFKGTTIEEGKARALVVHTGLNTEMGKIASLLAEEKKEDTPLQKELTNMGQRLSIVILGISALVFLLLVFKEQSVIESFLTAVALSVAAIPEGLPAIVAVVLSLGVLTLAKKKTIVRTLKAVETLGAVRYLFTDKTGTLTWNKINAVALLTAAKHEYTVEGEGYALHGEFRHKHDGPLGKKKPADLDLFVRSLVLCNGAELDLTNRKDPQVIGDTTEGAFLVMAARYGESYEKIREGYEILDEEPFSSVTKRMMVLVRSKETGKTFIFAKGAPEAIFALCKQNTQVFSEKIEEWAQNGWRNLAAAYMEVPAKMKKLEGLVSAKTLNFLGVVAEEDTIRRGRGSGATRQKGGH